MTRAYEIRCEEHGISVMDGDVPPTKCPACDKAPESVRQTFVEVAVYMIDRAWGGPEEGGWYYDCGERCKDRKTYRCASLEAAYKLASKINASLNENENVGRPDINSVLSRGKYRAKSFAGGAPDYFPHERPYYC